MGGFVCWYRITRYIRQQDEEEAREDLEDRIVLLRESLTHGQQFGSKFWGRYHPSGRDQTIDFKQSEKITEDTEVRASLPRIRLTSLRAPAAAGRRVEWLRCARMGAVVDLRGRRARPRPPRRRDLLQVRHFSARLR